MSGDTQSCHCWRLMLVVSLAHIADVGSGCGPQPQCLVGTAGGDPRTVGAERHAVHIGLRGVRLRRVRGKGAASGMTSSLTWTCPTAGSPRTGTATAPSTGRWCGDESSHQRGAPQAQERLEVIHINTDWRGRAKPGPWYGRYYEDGTPPTQGVGTRTGGARPVYAGALWDPPRWPGIRPGFARKG